MTTGLDFWSDELQPSLLWEDFDDYRCEIGVFYREYGRRFSRLGSDFWGNIPKLRGSIWAHEHRGFVRRRAAYERQQIEKIKDEEEQRAGDHPAWDKEKRRWKSSLEMLGVKLSNNNSVREKENPNE